MRNGGFGGGGAFLCGRMSGDCNDDIDAEEVEAVLADNAGTLPQPFSLSTHNLHKTRYLICTTGFDS